MRLRQIYEGDKFCIEQFVGTQQHKRLRYARVVVLETAHALLEFPAEPCQCGGPVREWVPTAALAGYGERAWPTEARLADEAGV